MDLRALFVALLSVSFCAVSEGQLLNSSFEIPDPNRATPWFTPPMYWQWDDTPGNLNYVGLHRQFTPRPEQRQPVYWSIPSPVEGDYFVVLSTGDAQGMDSAGKTLYSRIEQLISICPGDMISGYYFFGTCDYLPYDDTGRILLEPVDPNDGLRPVILAEISTEDVGNYGSTHGWQYFHHRFDGPQCGQYVLSCEVRDYLDKIYKSYLALDNFRLCRNVPKFGDFNTDCAIDYHDFDIMAQAWLADCNDPNVVADPNIPCELLITDPNHIDGFITIDHLMLLSEHWLERFD
ncbi:MAG TPA: hypothetical protein ENN97_00825 [Phycisphaerales bacterium]|nr:hypothetical protein [Phycisphaerales bacterium]